MSLKLQYSRPEIVRLEQWLMVRFPLPQIMLSWAIHGGGRRKSDSVVWRQVGLDDLEPPVDPKDFLRQKLLEIEMHEAVALLTSADLDSYVDLERASKNLSVRCIATVGLSNALRVGDPPNGKGKIGTINLMCHVAMPLTEEAHLEALSIAVEARSAAMLEAGIPSVQTGRPATGTGTDCVVIAAPDAEEKTDEMIRYAGKHTEAGHLIGRTVFEAVSQGIQQWKLAKNASQ